MPAPLIPSHLQCLSSTVSRTMPGIVAHPSRQLVTSASNIVIKIGSALLTTRGSHDGAFLKFANEVCSLRDEGRQVSLVSSGAISQGVYAHAVAQGSPFHARWAREGAADALCGRFLRKALRGL